MGTPRIVVHPLYKEKDNKRIYIRYTFRGNILYVPTGQVIDKSQILLGKDGKIKESILRTTAKNHITTRKKINEIHRKVIDAVEGLEFPTVDEVKTILNGAKEKKVEQVKKDSEDIEVIFNRFIQYSVAQKTRSTINQLTSSKNRFIKFLNDTRLKRSYQNITDSYYNKYLIYLDKFELMDSTRDKLIKDVKAFFRFAIRDGYTLNINLENWKRISNKPNKPLPLFPRELELIRKVELNGTLANTRDVFLFQCNTGLRISDLYRVGKQHIKAGWLRMTALKTRGQIAVPLSNEALKILEKWDYQLPLISVQKYREHITDLCKAAGLNEPIEVLESRGGTKTAVVKPKYEYITSHNAVDSFISNCLAYGFTPREVATMTGKTEAVIFKHYSGSDEQSIETKMKDMTLTSLP